MVLFGYQQCFDQLYLLSVNIPRVEFYHCFVYCTTRCEDVVAIWCGCGGVGLDGVNERSPETPGNLFIRQKAKQSN